MASNIRYTHRIFSKSDNPFKSYNQKITQYGPISPFCGPLKDHNFKTIIVRA